MNGVCYSVPDSSAGDREAIKLLPMLDRSKQGYNPGQAEIFYFSYGQAGFSVHLTPSREIIMGAPGALLWTGWQCVTNH